MKKTLLITLLLATITFCLHAQSGGIESLRIPVWVADSLKGNKMANKYQAGIHLSTQGFGVNGLYNANDWLAVRLSASYAPINFSQNKAWGNTQYDVNFDTDFGNVQIQGDFKPFKSKTIGLINKFAFSVGGAYFFKRDTYITAKPLQGFQYGEIFVNAVDVGEVNVKSSWSQIAPYGGIALKGIRIDDGVSFNFDLGTYYISSPQITMTATKLLASNVDQQQTIQNNVKSYNWLPVVQFGLSYHFK